MYWYVGLFVRFITFLLRVVQVFAVIYFFISIIFWFCAVAQLKIAYSMAPYYQVPVDIIKGFHIQFDSALTVFHPEIFLAVILLFVFLLLYNLIFIPVGSIEKFFIERSYDKGEKDYK